jgi:hypothetical protein
LVAIPTSAATFFEALILKKDVAGSTYEVVRLRLSPGRCGGCIFKMLRLLLLCSLSDELWLRILPLPA